MDFITQIKTAYSRYVLHALKEGLQDDLSSEEGQCLAILYKDSYKEFFRSQDTGIKPEDFLAAYFRLKNIPEHMRECYQVVPVDIEEIAK